jgi:endo-1,4-beta-D-glucanase Y
MLALLVLAACVVGVRAMVTSRNGTFDAQAADAFFSRYASDDGRIVRHDQDGDTVSEGQAYGMLLAVALEDRERFDAVWGWTREHLRRDDGLLSWRYRDGRVADEQPAADADVDAAYALLLAAQRFDEPSFRDEGVFLARAIMRSETITAGSARLLAAGPWAVPRRVVNPSYLDERAFGAFAVATGDDGWRAMARGVEPALGRLTDDGARLPVDWARVDGDEIHPIDGPDARSGDGAYGFDAARTLVRCAVGNSATRSLAAKWWTLVEAADDRHPVFTVAAAAAADAAGDRSARDDLLERAVDDASRSPTYYGSAWAALGGALLDPKALRPT